MTEIRQDAVN